MLLFSETCWLRQPPFTAFGWWFTLALQYFPLTALQLQPPATSQVTVFFSHSTPASASSSSLPNAVIVITQSRFRKKNSIQL